MDELLEHVQWFYKAYSGNVRWDDSGRIYKSPPEIPNDEDEYPRILCGEILYHLRSCLEHIAYQLACANRGKHVDGTQFPIDDDPEIFEVRITGGRVRGRWFAPYLADLHPDHIDLIRQVQPFPWSAP